MGRFPRVFTIGRAMRRTSCLHNALTRADLFRDRTQRGRIFVGFARRRAGCLRFPPPRRVIRGAAITQPFLLEISPSQIYFGVLRPGQSARAVMAERNPSSNPLAIDRIETSCPCVKVSPTRVELGPGETKHLTLTFDPSAEPGFRGGLSVDVAGFGYDEIVLFRSRVNVEVSSQLGEIAVHSGAGSEPL